ncbi:MAG: MotA/TolQ/ExbB proton channel family protein [Acidimicrobiia bacterium]
MEYSLSPLSMFLNAGPVSKAVMALLVIASFGAWVLIIEGIFVAWRISRSLKDIRTGGSAGVLWPIEHEGQKALAVTLPSETESQRQDRILKFMNRAAQELMASARLGLPSLAIVASVGPFIGLFGTVWGIMSSFSGIAQAQETSLTVVAPGIAEALAATAYGLAAAIPASIGYNRLGATFSKLNDEVMQYVKIDAAKLGAIRKAE